MFWGVHDPWATPLLDHSQVIRHHCPMARRQGGLLRAQHIVRELIYQVSLPPSFFEDRKGDREFISLVHHTLDCRPHLMIDMRLVQCYVIISSLCCVSVERPWEVWQETLPREQSYKRFHSLQLDSRWRKRLRRNLSQFLRLQRRQQEKCSSRPSRVCHRSFAKKVKLVDLVLFPVWSTY